MDIPRHTNLEQHLLDQSRDAREDAKTREDRLQDDSRRYHDAYNGLLERQAEMYERMVRQQFAQHEMVLNTVMEMMEKNATKAVPAVSPVMQAATRVEHALRDARSTVAQMPDYNPGDPENGPLGNFT